MSYKCFKCGRYMKPKFVKTSEHEDYKLNMFESECKICGMTIAINESLYNLKKTNEKMA